MIKFARMAALAAAATLVVAPAFAVPVEADPKAKAHARIVKALTLTANEDLNFGTIVVDAIAGPETVTISSTGPNVCGSANLTCDFTNAQLAEYEVTGSNNMLVDVDTDVSDLTNQTSGGGETIQFTPDVDNFQVTLDSSSLNNPTVFNVGGSITIDTTTVEGRYEGDMEVTVDYN